MELDFSPEKPGFSSSDCASDPEERQNSEGEDEDDDRNHKHRRRDGHSQSVEGYSLSQGLTRPYRKRNRPFENGYSYREGYSQSGETLKNYNVASDRDFTSRFEKRRPNQASFSRAPLELNQRIRGNQTLSGEIGSIRGRGREQFSRGIGDSRGGLVDVASQIVQPGSVPSAPFAGRGLPDVSNLQSTSWDAFGLVPGVPNVVLDSFYPLTLQGALRPAIGPPMNIGMPRQRCRDFEERGFCLRGDMCPMEHGLNRIVVEDVQSLSQFNLPVSLPGSQLLGTSSGEGALPVISTASGSLANSTAFHARGSRPGINEDGFGLNSGVVGGSMAEASDVYDPDQPLFTNDDHQTLNQSNADRRESFLDMDLSDPQIVEPYEGFNDDLPPRSATTIGSQSSSLSGRIRSSKLSLGVKEKIDHVGTSSSYLARDIKSKEALINVDGNSPPVKESSLKPHGDTVRSIRKPSQKALRTLFVNGIPLKDNKREALFSHFQKFGEVIDIYIPMNSERAFVQFSKREEAEAALKAPDAVMGNRFIKLWWANRDNMPDDGISGTGTAPVAHGITLNRARSHPFVLDKGKDNPHPASSKDCHDHASVAQLLTSDHAKAARLPVSDHPKPMVANSPKAPPPKQKKLESLELLKEEIRKKQEMLDQKRAEFLQKMTKLEKQAGPKDVTVSNLTTKRLKGETPSDHAEAETSKASPRDNKATVNTTSAERAVPHAYTSHATVPVQELRKPSFRPLAPLGGPPFGVSRFVLDNRPKAFRIVSPLPAGLANVTALEEHFSAYGELLSVELEEPEVQETNDASVQSHVSARISFTTRRFAEMAFLHGKSWRGHKLHFMWLTPTSTAKEGVGSVDPSASSNMPSDTNVQPSGDDASTNSPKIDANVQPSGEDASTHSQRVASLEAGEDKDSKSTSTSFSSEKQLS
ncbi:hypothetical protein CDL12_05456 [Handroanthus impetiginosus]|uniref:Uncharacterized protein n=1 Tax=Handroanthus impetiginosus TaxID=429701 RepID=A0A2G9HWH3_9LAMI|nr:hypothetical protein CDL12_05456 [Handroanthus impetiginosus]